MNEKVKNNLKESEVVKKIKNYKDEIKKFFVGMDNIIDNIFYSILTKEHILLEGLPGIAKSQLAKTIIKNINGARVFQIQLSKYMSEDYIFGAINIKKLKEEGVIFHNTEGSLVTSDFAFIDEFFDGSDVLLRSLLEIMNERSFTRNAQKMECPLNSIIATSNYKRISKETEAILDRFLIKINLKPVEEINLLKKMVKSYYKYNKSGTGGVNANGYIKLPMEKRLEYEYIQKAYEEQKEIKINDYILNKYVRFLKEYSRQAGKYISPRTFNKGIKVLIVSAYLNGNNEVLESNFKSLKYVLCDGADYSKELLFDSLLNNFSNLKENEIEYLIHLNTISSETFKLKDDFENELIDIAFVKSKLEELKKDLDNLINKFDKKTLFAKTINDIKVEFSIIEKNIVTKQKLQQQGEQVGIL